MLYSDLMRFPEAIVLLQQYMKILSNLSLSKLYDDKSNTNNILEKSKQILFIYTYRSSKSRTQQC